MPVGIRVGRAVVTAGALASAVLAAQVAVNLTRIKTPTRPGRPVSERVSILLPLRNEAHRVTPCLQALLAQEGVEDLQIIVLDDGSTDGTAQVVREVVGMDPRVKILDADDVDPPAGWLGKPWACHRLAAEASGSILVFVDADVVLAPGAVAAAASLLRESGTQLVSPYPRQLAESALERLTQPLVNWSWMATLPMLLAETRNPAFCAAIGQFLVIDAVAYRAAGGHESVKEHVVEDVEVLRSLKRAGYHGIPVHGGDIATCRMYDGAAEVYDGYTKSLWSVFGSTPGALGGVAAMVLIYIVPPVAAVTARDRQTRAWGALGYATAVAGRVMVARRTGERTWPDALAMPASIGAFATLTVASLARRRRGSTTWKGRPLHDAV